jgi:N-acetylmuramoyl-L-alanine amidase
MFRTAVGRLPVLLCAAGFCVGSPAAVLERIAAARSATTTTLQLQIRGNVSPRSFMMSAPRRLVVDLPATRPAGFKLPAVSAPLQAIRVGSRPDGSLRIVSELAPGASASLQPAGTRRGDWQIVVRAPSAPRDIGSPAPVVARLPPSAPAAPAPIVSHAPVSGSRDIVVAVDAGHGGEDPGASGRYGTQEKRVTLAIAQALAARLNREPGVRAMLTRDADVFVPLRDRAARARNAGADLFVSIHADAVRDRDVEGASVYVLSDRGASSEAARLLADRENAADLKGVSLAGRNQTLASVLVDLSQTAALGSSVEAAGGVLRALDGVGAVRKPEVQHAAFVVLKSPDVPSMLIETAYISNPAEERKLGSERYQRQLADAIGAGIVRYFQDHPPDGTRSAAQRRIEATMARTQN